MGWSVASEVLKVLRIQADVTERVMKWCVVSGARRAADVRPEGERWKMAMVPGVRLRRSC